MKFVKITELEKKQLATVSVVYLPNEEDKSWVDLQIGDKTYHREFDASGNVVSYISKKGDKVIDDITYRYNDQNRLIGVFNKQGYNTLYTYDEHGNICEKEVIGYAITFGHADKYGFIVYEETYEPDDTMPKEVKVSERFIQNNDKGQPVYCRDVDYEDDDGIPNVYESVYTRKDDGTLSSIVTKHGTRTTIKRYNPDGSIMFIDSEDSFMMYDYVDEIDPAYRNNM